MIDQSLNRREFLKLSGSVVIGFSLLDIIPAGEACAQQRGLGRPSLSSYPAIDSWLQINTDGTITVFTGKLELGQGIKTALAQMAAEELDVNLERVRMVLADTVRTPDEGYTAGSRSIEQSGAAIRSAAAEARAILLQLAAKELGAPVASLDVKDGVIASRNGGDAKVTYWALLGGQRFEQRATGKAPLKDHTTYRLVGRPAQNVDLPAIVSGAALFIQDLRLPNMVHARLVRPPNYGAELEEIKNVDQIESMAGVLKVVRDGSFLAVIAEREYQAMTAADALRRQTRWGEGRRLQGSQNLRQHLRALPGQEEQVQKSTRVQSALEQAAVRFSASYSKPYIMHGSIGPSCGIGLFEDEKLTVWTHCQGVYPLRGALAGLLQMDEQQIRVVGVQGAGCYGHNGADDAAADAALLARALPGRPVRVQWSREDEHGWEPYGSAMIMDVQAGVNKQGEIIAWNYKLISDTHATRPGGAAQWLLPAWHISRRLTPRGRGFQAGAYRNAEPLYRLPAVQITARWVEGPLRSSALRGLGAYANVFAIESFMDELAEKADIDPVVFRLRHLTDGRARAVIEAAATAAGWRNEKLPCGVGMGFARYKSSAAYCAVAVEAVSPAAGRVQILRCVAAVDAGQTINPNGLKNQIEGGILQSASWTLKEAVRFDDNGVSSRDWQSYPILRIPEAFPIEVQVLDRPDSPPLGAGEASQGPAAAAIANAIYRSSGVRVRDLPVSANAEVTLEDIDQA